MKNIKLIIILLILVNTRTYSQTHPVFTIAPVEETIANLNSCCTQFKDINNIYSKFLGDWVFNENNHYFKVTFYKGINRNVLGFDRCTEDYLYTRCIYKYNNIVIFDSYNSETCYIDSVYPYDSNSVLLNYDEPINPSLCLNKLTSLVTINYSLNTNNVPILNWNRELIPNIEKTRCQDGTFSNNYQEYNVPSNMILTKQ